MKKAVAGILAICVALSISACGSTPSANSSDTTQVNAQTSENTQPLEVRYPNIKAFDWSFADFSTGLIDLMQTSFPDALSDDPTVKDSKGDDTLPPNTSYTYDVGPGVTLTLYETSDTHELYQIFVYADLPEQNLGDSPNRIAFLCGLILGMFESDENTGNRIYAQLNPSNVSTPGTWNADGDASSWTYIVSDNNIMYNITAL